MRGWPLLLMSAMMTCSVVASDTLITMSGVNSPNRASLFHETIFRNGTFSRYALKAATIRPGLSLMTLLTVELCFSKC